MRPDVSFPFLAQLQVVVCDGGCFGAPSELYIGVWCLRWRSDFQADTLIMLALALESRPPAVRERPNR